MGCCSSATKEDNGLPNFTGAPSFLSPTDTTVGNMNRVGKFEPSKKHTVPHGGVVYFTGGKDYFKALAFCVRRIIANAKATRVWAKMTKPDDVVL